MSYINEMREALSEVAYNQILLQEGAIADKMRANLKAKKKDWDKKGEKAKSDAYSALDHAKKTQDELEKNDYINNIKEAAKKELRMAAGLPIESNSDAIPGYKKLQPKAEKRAKKIAAVLDNPTDHGDVTVEYTKEQFYMAIAVLMSEDYADTTTEAQMLLTVMEEIDYTLINCLFD